MDLLTVKFDGNSLTLIYFLSKVLTKVGIKCLKYPDFR